jgi:hypothetical protein
MYPLVVANAGPIAHLASTTLCHYSISAYLTTIKTKEGTMTLDGKDGDAAVEDLVGELAATSTAHGV